MSASQDQRGLEAVRLALTAAWSGRSPAEQIAFGAAAGFAPRPPEPPAAPPISERRGDPAASVAAAPSGASPASRPAGHARLDAGNFSDELITRLAEAAERIAAVSGGLDPRRLAAKAPAAVADQLLDRIAQGFDRRRVDGTWVWTLKNDRRAAILSTGRWRLPVLLAEASGVPTDEAGMILRVLLAGGPPDGAGPQPLVQALTWASSALLEFDTALEAAQHKVSMASILDGYDRLLAGGFFGRQAEVARLQAFAREPRSVGPIPVLSVSGVGGSGKSTLLAYALRPLVAQAFDDPAAPMVITLDFDRRAFQRGGELELSFELSRQVGVFVPSLAASLADLRAEIVANRSQRGEYYKVPTAGAAESMGRIGSEFDYRAGRMLSGDVRGRALILVLDTFEEWQRAAARRNYTDAPVWRVLEWVSNIQDAWNLGVGIIVSGRAPLPHGRFDTSGQPIGLRGLRRSEAVALVSASGVRRGPALKLCRIVGGNPLSLKLAARYYLKLPVPERAAFLTDPALDLTGLDEALRQGVLYKRFLEHVQDPRARRLAHPGLVLRSVSRDLIREVLAEPCNLGPINAVEADELFRLLEQEVWLVERRGEDLVHRPAARRAMMRSMLDDPALAPKVAEVHRHALRWYGRDGRDATEWLYHRLATAELADVDEILRTASQGAIQDVVRDAADLTDAVRAQLLLAAGRRLSLRDARFLPDAKRQRWANQRAEDLVSEGQPARALEVWRGFGGKGTPGPWLTAAKFGSGDWTYDPDLEAKTARTARNTNYAQHYLMAFVLRSSDPQAAKHLTAKLEKLVVDQLDDARSRRIGAASRLTQLQNLYFRTVAVDPEEIHVSREGSDEHYFPREDLQVRATIATIYQRCRTLAPFADPRTPQDARRVLSNAFQPTQDWLETAARRVEGMSGVDPAPLRDFVDDFGRKITLWHFEGEPAMIPPYRSASVLGRWADQFAESVIAGFGSHLPEASLFALVGPRSDDPEWRAPLRAAFTAAIRSPEDIERVALTAATAMGQWCPYDLQYVPMMELIKGAPRTAWLRILEFLDRCRGLGALAEAFVNHPDHRLARSCRAYLDWDSCCDLLVEASRAAMPS